MVFDPPSPLAGEVVAVTAVVRNAGTADAPATIAGVTVDGTQTCAEIPTLALPINQTAAVVCSLTAPPNGSHGVGVCADVTNVADEPDESNNCLLQTLVVGAGVTARP
jgi:subtilase family serine protease